jgi:TetR/AcrR family transcriptional regulator, fatty acid metabolism regulator protein
MNVHSFSVALLRWRFRCPEIAVPAASPSRRPRATPPATASPKRDAILRAALQVFAERGFFNAQVADVARAAGVAAGTVYLYFHGKDDLLVSIFERTMREAIEEGRAALAGIEDPEERLRRIARLHLERLGRDRHLAVVFQVELRQSTKFMERFSSTLLRDYLGLIRETIAAGQASGTFRDDLNPTVAAKILFGGIDEMATNWILSRRRYSLAAQADAVIDLFVNGVKRPRSRRAPVTEIA